MYSNPAVRLLGTNYHKISNLPVLATNSPNPAITDHNSPKYFSPNQINNLQEIRVAAVPKGLNPPGKLKAGMTPCPRRAKSAGRQIRVGA